jgi:ATP-binding cassette subfamily F protein uup
VVEYVGGYDDYVRQSGAARESAAREIGREPHTPLQATPEKRARPRKLTYNEQRELEALPARIAALEEEQSRLKHETASADFYKSPADHIHAVLARIDSAQQEHDEALARWLELEELR